MFMLAMAQVSGVNSWPNSFSGANFVGFLLVPFLPLALSSMAISHFIEEAAGAAGGVVDFHAGLGLEDAGHDSADLGRGVELAGALAAALGELADEVFVALADDVGLDVVEPEALGADGLDQVGEAVVVEVALAVGGGVEVDAVDDALQERIFPGDGPHVGGDTFADLVGELADDGPDGLLRDRPARGAGRSGRASYRALASWKAFLREPTSAAMRFSSSSKTSQRRLVKTRGRM